VLEGYAVYDKYDRIMADTLCVSFKPVQGGFMDRANRRDCEHAFLLSGQGNKFASMVEATAEGYRIEKVTVTVNIVPQNPN
jgi:hypothetical protein